MNAALEVDVLRGHITREYAEELHRLRAASKLVEKWVLESKTMTPRGEYEATMLANAKELRCVIETGVVAETPSKLKEITE